MKKIIIVIDATFAVAKRELEKSSQRLRPGLSLRGGGRGFPPATKNVAPGYFYWKIEEK